MKPTRYELVGRNASRWAMGNAGNTHATSARFIIPLQSPWAPSCIIDW